MKTNAMRILETKKIPFELVTYPFDEEALDAIHAARTVGLDPKTVFKTIVLVNERKQYWVFCLPADRSINMKKARSLTGSKALELVKLSEIQNVTGYLRGGCSPIGMKRPFPTFIEEAAFDLPFIYVSAGRRGMQVRLNPADLLLSVDGKRADFI
ncbi:MAG TPA: Cys-tRNA(Pro) deacylase [Sphaerochaeta sp.]|jgi:Cys-tRNA(Pro)/Cys-tRNA(Cys) deacylase|nr:Cys-tRNA(Pro) deacylase [Spirochaetales bacterium]HPX28520.1 Cys-tRNA(Pro) deacylase [Sphaerochaeta sp.]HQB54788.1 Cys-tRNA(Pro) deacylase [Sphaerochaeta sp.]